MDNFFPYIYIKKQEKQQELEPLYLEIEEPQYQKEEMPEKENPGIIIIQL